MFERRLKYVIILMLTVFISGVVYLSSRASSYTSSPHSISSTGFDGQRYSAIDHLSARHDADGSRQEFDVDSDRDVLVFLHIQKTGGTTFGRHLVKNMDIETPCVCYKHRKRCDCINAKKRIWLFSRYSTGWACGLHADWTELHDCVPDALDDKEEKKRERR